MRKKKNELEYFFEHFYTRYGNLSSIDVAAYKRFYNLIHKIMIPSPNRNTLLLLLLLLYPSSSVRLALLHARQRHASSALPMSSNIVAKCGVREFFFEGNQCPWSTVKTKKILVHGVIRMGSVPESCWYDRHRYSLSFHKHGDEKALKTTLQGNDIGDQLSRNPQCHISMQLIVAKHPQQQISRAKEKGDNEFNDLRSSGFQPEDDGGGKNIVLEDKDLRHHMDNKFFKSIIDQTKNENDYAFVKPKGWEEIIDPDTNSVIFRPHPEDFQHLPQELDDITRFQTLDDDGSGKNYGKIQFGPIVGLDGAIVSGDVVNVVYLFSCFFSFFMSLSLLFSWGTLYYIFRFLSLYSLHIFFSLSLPLFLVAFLPPPPIYYLLSTLYSLQTLLSTINLLLRSTQVYDDSGYPKYHDQFNERDYSDLPFTERPRYNVQQYPEHLQEQQAEFVKDQAPA